MRHRGRLVGLDDRPLTASWQAEHANRSARNLPGVDYAYRWANGIFFTIAIEDYRLCTLVIFGARPDGSKELVALDNSDRESTESWAEVLRALRDRSLAAPMLTVGDRALGFWAALRDVFPNRREERCWLHKAARVLGTLPKRLQPDTKAKIAAIYGTDTRAEALTAVMDFADSLSGMPKAIAKIRGAIDQLLAFYDLTAEHWVHLRTMNPIESTFSTVRLAPESPDGPDPARRRSEWHTKSSTPPRTAGARSPGPNSSLSFDPVPPSSTASCNGLTP
jgi:transposase-like protein